MPMERNINPLETSNKPQRLTKEQLKIIEEATKLLGDNDFIYMLIVQVKDTTTSAIFSNVERVQAIPLLEESIRMMKAN